MKAKTSKKEKPLNLKGNFNDLLKVALKTPKKGKKPGIKKATKKLDKNKP